MRHLLLLPLLAFAVPVAAQDMSAFQTGPVFSDFGPHAPVEGIGKLPASTEFKVVFNVHDGARDGKRNEGIESAARFINMNVAHGVPEDNIHIAIVAHGKALFDLLGPEGWAAHGRIGANPSAAMVQALLDHGVRIIVCGQSRAALGIKPEEVIPGVETALSAMDAFALLQQQGYSVNP